MKPILFNTDMVYAILDGRKSVTRRPVKFRPGWNPKWTGYEPDGPVLYGSNNIPAAKATYRPGDILYVKETWNCLPIPEPLRGTSKTYWYKADECNPDDKWRPSIHMPKEAARLFLRVTGVWVERVRDITEAQARAEGFSSRAEFLGAFLKMYPGCTEDSWVWVIEFERISKEEALKGGEETG